VNPIFERDGWRCVVTGDRAESVHHRIHGDRTDMRPSNLLSVSGSGTTGGHGWIEAHWKFAAHPSRGWTVSKFDPSGGPPDTTKIPVFMANGPLGTGMYLLDDDYNIRLADDPDDLPRSPLGGVYHLPRPEGPG
jgi:hypothetical protein